MYKHWSHNSHNNSFTGASEVQSSLSTGQYNLRCDNFGNPVAFKLATKDEAKHQFTYGPMANVVAEANKFWDSEARYRELGVAYKRCFLLHGPAGCGKTGIIMSLIESVIERNGLAFHVSDPSLFTSAFYKVRQIEGARPVLAIIEDIDKMCEYDEVDLLELLDGSSNISDGVLFVTTTNYLDKMPARIRCRPSRVDTLLKVDLPNRLQRYEYLCFICSGAFKQSTATISEWAEVTEGLSLAAIKEVVVALAIYGSEVKETIERLKEMQEAKDGADEE